MKSDKESYRALQSFAESEDVSDEESGNGFDIIESSRKALDLSQYIEGESLFQNRYRQAATNPSQLLHTHEHSHETSATKSTKKRM